MLRILRNKPHLISALSVSYLTAFNYITTQQDPVPLRSSFILVVQYVARLIYCMSPKLCSEAWSILFLGFSFCSGFWFGGFFPYFQYLGFQSAEIPVLFPKTSIWGPCVSPRHVSSPTWKLPTLFCNIRIWSPTALCPNVFIPSTEVPVPYLLQSCQKGSFFPSMLCQTNTEPTAEAATLFNSHALRQHSHSTYLTAPVGDRVVVSSCVWEQAEILQRTRISNVSVWSGTFWSS